MALLTSIRRWLGSSHTNRTALPPERWFHPTLEGMEERLLLTTAPGSLPAPPVLSGQWFVQSDGLAASITQNGNQLTLTNEFGQQTLGQWLSPTSFQAWGQVAQVVQIGPVTQILWSGNVWSQSTWQDGALAGQWFVQSNGQSARITQNGTQIVLTNEHGQQTTGQWLNPTSFSAWGVTAQIVQNGPITEILWNGNTWSQSRWQTGGLVGQWFVQSDGLTATISQSGTQLLLTNEQGQQTVAQWYSPTTFSAWGVTAQIVQNGPVTQILWNGNTWSQSSWQNGGLDGQWFVQSDGQSASITQNGTQMVLTNEQGQQTVAQWLTPTTFSAWGQTAQVVQNGPITKILWNGDTWSQSSWQNGALAGQWFAQSNGQSATIIQSGGQLVLINEQGQQTTGQWLSPTSFSAWGQTAQIVQNGPLTQILWNGNTWSQSKWQNGGLSGEWFVQSNGMAAFIVASGSQIVLTNEYGQQTMGQWLSPTTFSAWGVTAQIVQNGPITQILWNGNIWSQSTWQDGALAGQWIVASNGQPASIVQDGTLLWLTNEQGQQTLGQWLSPTAFSAWGVTAQVVQNGPLTQVQWNGNTWTQFSVAAGAPTSNVLVLPAVENSSSFSIAWSGLDNMGGSGIASYTIYVSDNGGAYTQVSQASAAGSATFTGAPGHTYNFYSIATDKTGNVQSLPTTPQASTTVRLTTALAVISSALNNASIFGQPITYTATVSASDPAAVIANLAGETVAFLDGGKTLGTGTFDSNGVATFVTTTALTAGTHTITAVYNGDSAYQGSSGTLPSGLTVTPAGTTTTVTSSSPNNTSTYGQAVTFAATVTLTGTGSASAVSGEKVTFKDGSTNLGTATLNSSGVATFTTTALAGGNHTITAVYNGDSNNQGSSGALSGGQTVNSAGTTTAVISSSPNNTSSFGQSVTFTATVTGAGSAIAEVTGQKVTFLDGSTTLGTGVLNSSGIATLITKTTQLAPGNNAISAVYNGDADFTGSSGVLANGQTVNPAATTLRLSSSSPNSTSAYGQSVTFTALVTIAGTAIFPPPGETVTFLDGSTTLGTGTLNSIGVATFITTATQLAPGNHAISAVYNGDSALNGTSGTLPSGQTVNPAPTALKLSSSSPNNTSTAGQAVSFTAQVTTSIVGAGTPTGTVSFYDGITFLGRSNLSNGQAVFTPASPLPIGQNSIKAVYDDPSDAAGIHDTNFRSSFATLVQTVKAPPPIDVSSQVVVVRGGFGVPKGKPYTFTQVLTLTNNGSSAITGPVYLELTGLPAGVSLYNANGSVAGVPYLLVSNGPLAAHASISITLDFLDPGMRVAIGYSTKVVAGGIP
jgi:hypothetical protein